VVAGFYATGSALDKHLCSLQPVALDLWLPWNLNSDADKAIVLAGESNKLWLSSECKSGPDVGPLRRRDS